VYSIWFDQAGNATGFFGGNNVFKSTNYGVNWASIGSLGTGAIGGIAGLPMWSGNVWYVKNGNANIYFGFGQTSWVVQYTAPAGTYRHITTERIPNYPFHGYAVRTNGGISHTFIFVEGIKNIGGEIPNDFSLGQNYPNPFNPSTSFKIQVPQTVFVSVKVYNILGIEITTLVNEQLSPGTYEVEFDGTDYSSGVYYYNLRAFDFSDVKKMVLIK
jgi:hypothetical protein